MPNYVDAGCQTVWAGLTRQPVVRPDILFTAPDTTTPPDDLVTEKPQDLALLLLSEDQPSPAKSTLRERHAMNGPKLVARIPLPHSKFDSDALLSPPPTNALHSPLPAANTLHAGHTPRVTLALSPGELDDEKLARLHVFEEAQSSYQDGLGKDHLHTPEDDVALKGPLSLPALPTVLLDGTDEHIALDALDKELNRIARDQQRFSKLKDAPGPSKKPETIDEDIPLSRKSSASRTYSTHNAGAPDGVILKSPRMNFGAPIGQAPRRRSEPSGKQPQL